MKHYYKISNYSKSHFYQSVKFQIKNLPLYYSKTYNFHNYKPNSQSRKTRKYNSYHHQSPIPN